MPGVFFVAAGQTNPGLIPPRPTSAQTRSRRGRWWLLLAAAVGLALRLPGSLAAQAPTATLLITVRTAETDAPLRGAHVSVVGAGRGATTDRQGLARVTGIPAGRHDVEVRMIGYAERTLAITFGAGVEVVRETTLAVAPVEIERVDAVTQRRNRGLEAIGYYERKQRGQGTFVERESIEARNPRLLSDDFRRMPGVRVVSMDHRLSNSFKLEIARGASRLRTADCPVIYFLDGVRVPLSSGGIDALLGVRQVEAIEVYRGAAQVPVQFNTTDASCGVVAMWTRRE